MTGSGKITRVKGLKSHLRRNKSARSKRLFDETISVQAVDVHRLKRLMPYCSK